MKRVLHKIEEDLESWDGGLLAVLEAEYILWTESRMDALSPPSDLDSPDSPGYQL